MRKETLEEIKKISENLLVLEKRIESSQDEEEILIECLKLGLKISSLGDEYFYNVVDSLAKEKQ